MKNLNRIEINVVSGGVRSNSTEGYCYLPSLENPEQQAALPALASVSEVAETKSSMLKTIGKIYLGYLAVVAPITITVSMVVLVATLKYRAKC